MKTVPAAWVLSSASRGQTMLFAVDPLNVLTPKLGLVQLWMPSEEVAMHVYR